MEKELHLMFLTRIIGQNIFKNYRLLKSLRQRSTNTEAQVAATEVGRVVTSIRRPAVVGIEVVTAAAINPV